PRASERSTEHHCALRVARRACVFQRGAHVLGLRSQPREPLRLVCARQLRFRLERKVEIVGEVSLAGSVELAACLELLRGVLANGLEHEESTGLSCAEEALVDKRLERIEIRAADVLCGVGVETPGKDIKPSEVAFVAVVEEVVAP